MNLSERGYMEKSEISEHQLRVFQYVVEANRWLTNHQIIEGLAGENIAPRTIRQHTKHLVDLGIFDQAEVFPSHAYRFSEKAKQRNGGYLLRLQKAQEVFSSLSS